MRPRVFLPLVLISLVLVSSHLPEGDVNAPR